MVGLAVFRNSNLKSGRVSISPTFNTYKSRSTDSGGPSLVTRTNFDPNTLIHDEGQFVDSPETKIETLTWTDEQMSHAVWSKTRGSSLPFYILLKDANGVEIRKADTIVKKLLSDFAGLIKNKTNDKNAKDSKGINKGYVRTKSMKLLIAQILRSIIKHGAIAGELVLDKQLKPDTLVLIHPSQIEWEEKKNGVMVPWQVVKPRKANNSQTLYDSYGNKYTASFLASQRGTEKVSLDIPTFFMSILDESLIEPHPISPMLPALHSVFPRRTFINDMAMVLKRMAWPRLSAKVVGELIKNAMPQDYVGDPKKEREFISSEMTALKNMLEVIEPGQAVIHSDYFEMGTIESKMHSTGGMNPEPVLTTMNLIGAQANKTFGSVLGGSDPPNPLQVYLESMSLKGYQEVCCDFMSKVLTMFLRLQGQNMIAEFNFVDFEMRPASELESARSQRIANDLTMLYLGAITPEEFSNRNTGSPLPEDSVLWDLYNNLDKAERKLGLQEEKIAPSDTDTPKSPAKQKTKEGDGRGKPEATRKRGKEPAAKKTGKIKESRTGTTRTPRQK